MKCKLTGCQNTRHATRNWVFCDPCMAKTTRRLLHELGIWEQTRTDMPDDPTVMKAMHETVKYVNENADELVELERMADVIARRKRESAH